MATVRCQTCKTLRETRRSDPDTWACPVCPPAPAAVQTFTVDPRGTQTQFAAATRPAHSKG